MHGIVRSVCLLVAFTAVSVASFYRTEKSTNMAKEANFTTMSFLDTTAKLQRTNTTIRQLSRHAFGILVDNDLAACRLPPIINQEFTPCPENERVHEQHGLGLPVRSAHDHHWARPLDAVDPGGELEYYALHIRNVRALFRKKQSIPVIRLQPCVDLAKAV
jgi:hypothetical protein